MRTRKLHIEEYPLFERHLKRLAAEERLLRFDYAISDEQIKEYILSIHPNDILIGLFSSNQLIGAAHLSTSDQDERDRSNVELGISVESEYHSLGLGTELMHAAITVAYHEGYESMEFLCQSNNIAMIRIADKFGAKIDQSHGHARAYIDLSKQEAPPKMNKHEHGLASMRTHIL